jgi:hypothetical protein
LNSLLSFMFALSSSILLNMSTNILTPLIQVLPPKCAYITSVVIKMGVGTTWNIHIKQLPVKCWANDNWVSRSGRNLSTGRLDAQMWRGTPNWGITSRRASIAHCLALPQCCSPAICPPAVSSAEGRVFSQCSVLFPRSPFLCD